MSTSMFDEYDIFKTMHPVKLQVMKELAENMQGKSMKDAAPLLMAATTKLKNHNLSFSPEDSDKKYESAGESEGGNDEKCCGKAEEKVRKERA